MEDLVTTVSVTLPRGPLTIADYLALPEDLERQWELQEGMFVMSPRPTFDHNLAASALAGVLRDAAPTDLLPNLDVEIDLGLAPADEGATVRCPDVLVARSRGVERIRAEGGVLRPDEVVVVVEVVSPGSRRTDRIVKLAEYADAGIPHYWIVDLDDGPSLVEGRLVAGTYEQREPVTGEFRTDAPFPVTVDLAALV